MEECGLTLIEADQTKAEEKHGGQESGQAVKRKKKQMTKTQCARVMRRTHYKESDLNNQDDS